jgi:hypothetical protein
MTHWTPAKATPSRFSQLFITQHTMTPSNVLAFVLGATVAALTVFDMKVVEAFSTGSSKMTFQPARVVQGARLVASTVPSTKHSLVALSMSGEPGSSTTETSEGESKPMPTSGTYYDDEVRVLRNRDWCH